MPINTHTHTSGLESQRSGDAVEEDTNSQGATQENTFYSKRTHSAVEEDTNSQGATQSLWDEHTNTQGATDEGSAVGRVLDMRTPPATQERKPAVDLCPPASGGGDAMRPRRGRYRSPSPPPASSVAAVRKTKVVLDNLRHKNRRLHQGHHLHQPHNLAYTSTVFCLWRQMALLCSPHMKYMPDFRRQT